MHLNELIHKKSYEHVVHVLRRHPITFVPKVALLIVLALVPLGLQFVFEGALPELVTENNSRALLILLASFYYLSILVFFYAQFIDYYLDMWIVTNDRIVNVEQRGLFARTVAELDLYKIQDITSDVSGIIASIFDYGHVNIQTAGAELRFNFIDVKTPHKLRKEIIELVRVDRKYHSSQPKTVQ